jgi:hypothetical protein
VKTKFKDEFKLLPLRLKRLVEAFRSKWFGAEAVDVFGVGKGELELEEKDDIRSDDIL